MKTLYTERLILRKYQSKDYDALKKTWMEYEATHKELNAEDLCRIDKWICEFACNDYNWVAEERDSGITVGNINVIKISRKHRNCELGYAVCREQRRKGYATEMLREVIRYLLYEESFHIVSASHYSGNLNSGKVMKKAGMHKEAELTDRRYNFKTDLFENLIYYCIAAE